VTQSNIINGEGGGLEEFRIFNEKDATMRGLVTFGAHVFVINK